MRKKSFSAALECKNFGAICDSDFCTLCAPKLWPGKLCVAGDATIMAESLWRKLLYGGIGSADHTHVCVVGISEACNREQKKLFRVWETYAAVAVLWSHIFETEKG